MFNNVQAYLTEGLRLGLGDDDDDQVSEGHGPEPGGLDHRLHGGWSLLKIGFL